MTIAPPDRVRSAVGVWKTDKLDPDRLRDDTMYIMMRGNRLHFRFLQVVVLAVAGMVLTAGSASACGTKGEAARHSCCSSAPAPEHGVCCEPTRPAPARAESHADAIDGSTASLVFDPASSSSCECRASEPASPAEHQSRTTAERLDAEGFGLPADIAPATGPPPRIDRSTLPNERPPHVPLYLRTSRLLT